MPKEPKILCTVLIVTYVESLQKKYILREHMNDDT